jgi:hypothetical protein
LEYTCAEEGEEGEDEEGEREEEINLQEFAECTEIEIIEEEDGYYRQRKLDEEEGDKVYAQIFCQDGSSLKLGLFSDEDCSDYIGNEYDIAEITGLNVTESILENELTSDCVSCSASVSVFSYDYHVHSPNFLLT